MSRRTLPEGLTAPPVFLSPRARYPSSSAGANLAGGSTPPALFSPRSTASFSRTRSSASPRLMNVTRFVPFRDPTIAKGSAEMPVIETQSLARSTKPLVNSEASEMSIALQARSHIGAIVQFVAPSLPMKSALPRVAAYVGINARRARALWNKEARAVLASEIHALEAARARIAERIITKEISDHANTLEVHASRLAFTDADFHGPEIARLRRLAQRARNFLDDGEA